MTPSSPAPPSHASLAPILERNIRAVLERRLAEEKGRSTQDRVADAITRFTGSLRFVYIHVVLFGAWIVWNLPSVPTPKFDPSLVVLAMAASVEAIFLSTFILITQNRITAEADKRADLDLQVSLLAEHEITRLVELVSAIAEKVGVDVANAQDLEPLKKDVAPEQVLDKLEEQYRKNDDARGNT